MSIDEGTWVRRMRPEAEAALIRRLAKERAMGALRHRTECSCGACRIQRDVFNRYLSRAVTA